MAIQQKRATSILDNAREHVEQLEADSPSGVPIIGTDTRVTGGTTQSERDAEPFGQMWLCRVVELDLPYSKDVQVVSLNCRSGSYRKLYRTNTDVVLPEAAIKVIEDAVVVNERRATIGGTGMSIDAAERMNPGMTVVRRQDGDYWLVEKRPRFHVQRIKPYQESYAL